MQDDLFDRLQMLCCGQDRIVNCHDGDVGVIGHQASTGTPNHDFGFPALHLARQPLVTLGFLEGKDALCDRRIQEPNGLEVQPVVAVDSMEEMLFSL